MSASVTTGDLPRGGSPAPVREGDVLAGKYRVETVLGVGGMGVVVAAHHVDLDQKVALKFLLPTAAMNDELVGRFLREARASVRLKGAHVAKVLDVGRLEDNCPYIVMEFLEGRDLHAELKVRENGPLPIEDAMSWLVQAAEGLAEAHSLGIVHRDLKPGNLFLTRGPDGRPLVKVLDFGISKTIDQSIGGEAASLTKTEMLLGSPLYMSPEQMRSSKNVDERSDLWALGAIAFELLTGRVPFEADTILELCFKVAQEKAPSPKDFRPEIPDALAAAILRCLEKDPNNRFQNVGEVARAFEAFAPVRDRGTAERALEVLGAGKRKPAHSIPAAGEISPVTPAPTPAPALVSALAVTPPPSAAPRPPSQGDLPGAWGGTHAQSSPMAQRARRNKLIAVAAIAAVALTGIAFAIRSGAKSDGPTTSATSTNEGPSLNPPPPALDLPSPPTTGAPPAETASADPAATANAAPKGTPANTANARVGNAPPPGKVPVTTPPTPSAAKSAKPGASAAPPAQPAAPPPPAAPASSGFIRVRE